jgi:adenosylhomocysteinase
MPGLMALRQEFADAQPLAGARISVSLSITVQTAVFVETLAALGARVRLASCNIFSTQDEAAAALVVGSGSTQDPIGISVWGWKGETSAEFWWCLDRTLDWSEFGQSSTNPADNFPTALVDDGGDVVFYIHSGVEFEQGKELEREKSWSTHEFEIVRDLLASSVDLNPKRFTELTEHLIGASEETTTGIQRLDAYLNQGGELHFPVINVNDAVTKSKFDNKYGIRHSLVDGLNRATDVLIGGKVAFVAGYGDVGKGCAEALRGQGARVIIGEIDPICALQAAMDGYQVARLESVIGEIDFLVTATGNRDIVRADHFLQLKNLAIVCNVGHFNNEINMDDLEEVALGDVIEIKPLVHQWNLTNGRSVIVLSEGRVMNLGNATGHPSFVMSTSFSNQVIAQIELAQNGRSMAHEVHRIDKLDDEKVARTHLAALGAELTELREDQASYLGLDAAGPFKPQHYRY